MKRIYKIGILIMGFILITGLVYATVTVASDRKSSKLPWQGTPNGFYDSAHNVGDSYLPESRFGFATGSIAGGESVIYDSVTGLYWQSNGTVAGTKTWESAKTYCADLELGGYTDWRLPDYTELLSIVDLSKYNPAIDQTYFTVYFSNGYYWSSTTYATNTTYAWRVYFYYGNTGYNSKTNNTYVRCIR